MADPVIPFHSTLLSRSSEKRAAVRFAGFGNRLAEALPSPLPAGPLHETQLAAKSVPPWFTSSCKSPRSRAGRRTVTPRLYPPTAGIATEEGGRLAGVCP